MVGSGRGLHGVDRGGMALPSVPFLNPIGIDRPEAISRWVWLSVVRAPMAVQLIRSAMYCGTTGSSSSVAAGRPSLRQVEQQGPGPSQAGVDVVAAVEVGIVDHPLPAHRGAGLLEIHPHHHLQLVAVSARWALAMRSAYSLAASTSWTEQGPTITSCRWSPACRIALILSRACCTALAACAVIGSSRCSSRRRHQGPGFHHVEVGGGDHAGDQRGMVHDPPAVRNATTTVTRPPAGQLQLGSSGFCSGRHQATGPAWEEQWTSVPQLPGIRPGAASDGRLPEHRSDPAHRAAAPATGQPRRNGRPWGCRPCP